MRLNTKESFAQVFVLDSYVALALGSGRILKRSMAAYGREKETAAATSRLFLGHTLHG